MKKMIQPEALKVGENRISANDARSVKLDFAPMEGITGYVFRQAHAVIYGALTGITVRSLHQVPAIS